MAIVATSKAPAAAAGGKKFLGGKAKAAIAPLVVSLPTTPSVPSSDLSDFHFMIHGEKKIGKTTLTTVEDGVFLMTFDPAQKALAILQAYLPDWAHFEAYLKKLEEAAKANKYPYKRVSVDGADIWYRACQEYCCRSLGIKHPSEEDWGKGWDLIKTTFSKAVDRLMALPGGCWFISHSQWKEVETRIKGVKITKLLPLLKAGGEEILVGRVDGWFAYDYFGDERILIIQGDERTGAGHRVRGHFETPKGRRVVEIPMGDNEQEAWENFQKAFNNEQTFITLAERDQRANGGAPKPAITKKPLLKKPGK